MECRPISPREVTQAKALWKQAFQDSDAYINHNFRYHIDLTFSLGYFDKNKLASMLFMLPKTLVCCNREILTFFIAGVSTDPKYRMQGLARDLMERAWTFLFEKEVPVVFLYPFNHEFYEKLGFHTISHMRRISLEKPTTTGKANPSYRMEWHDKHNKPDTHVMQILYDAFALTKKAYFKRTAVDFDAITESMYVDNGRVAIIYNQNQPIGYMCYYLNGKQIHCTETVFLGRQAAEEMIKRVSAEHRGFMLLDEGFEIKGSVLEPYTMMRIVNPKQAESFYGEKDAREILSAQTMILEQY